MFVSEIFDHESLCKLLVFKCLLEKYLNMRAYVTCKKWHVITECLFTVDLRMETHILMFVNTLMEHTEKHVIRNLGKKEKGHYFIVIRNSFAILTNILVLYWATYRTLPSNVLCQQVIFCLIWLWTFKGAALKVVPGNQLEVICQQTNLITPIIRLCMYIWTTNHCELLGRGYFPLFHYHVLVIYIVLE